METISQSVLSCRSKLESQITDLDLPERDFRTDLCQYGAYKILGEYCRKPFAIPSLNDKEWQHGWHPPEHNIHPELVTGTTGKTAKRKSTCRFYVSREDQALYLKDCGYRFVESIGLPIVYVPPQNVCRIPNSLLIAPVHSTNESSGEQQFERYVDCIQSIAHQFDHVVACVHGVCMIHGRWVGEFESRGFPVVSGAHLADSNSLERMAKLFSRFEYVTSNAWGSHLVYAAFFGAKPSIYGPLSTLSRKDLSRRVIYKNCPELTDAVLNFHSEQYLRSKYRKFFVRPRYATECREWAAWQIGLQCKRSPREIRKLLQLTPFGQILQAFSKVERRIKQCLNGLVSITQSEE